LKERSGLNVWVLAVLFALVGCETTGGVAQGGGSADHTTAPVVVPKSFADIPISYDDVLDTERSLILGSGDSWTGRAFIRTKLSAEEAYDYYLNTMKDYGWGMITSVQSEISVLTLRKGDRVATVQIDGSSMRVDVIVTVSRSEEAL
jgi:hypothetical protein